jgi:hypothetical protein
VQKGAKLNHIFKDVHINDKTASRREETGEEAQSLGAREENGCLGVIESSGLLATSLLPPVVVTGVRKSSGTQLAILLLQVASTRVSR